MPLMITPSTGRRLAAMGRGRRWEWRLQPLLARELADALPRQPFGWQVQAAVERLRSGAGSSVLPPVLRTFGISSLAPVQVQLLRPCPAALMFRCICRPRAATSGSAAGPVASSSAMPGPFLLMAFGQQAPRLERPSAAWGLNFSSFSRAAARASWESCGRAICSPIPSRYRSAGRSPSLLDQLQQQLLEPDRRTVDATSCGRFPAVPVGSRPMARGALIRDRALQWLAADPSLEPRDVLVMTPQIDHALAQLGLQRS